MDDFLKNIKKKLSIENFLRKSEPKEESLHRDEDVRKTVEKMDPNALVDPDDASAKISELSAAKAEAAKAKSSKSKTVLKKSPEPVVKTPREEEDKVEQWAKDDVSFLD